MSENVEAYYRRVMRAGTVYTCNTCGEVLPTLPAARRHAKQGFRTQREAFVAGVLHSLTLTVKEYGNE